MNTSTIFSTLFLCFNVPVVVSVRNNIKNISTTSKRRHRQLRVRDSFPSSQIYDNNDLDILRIDVDETLKVYDTDKDGFLTLHEFGRFCHSHPLCLSEPDLNLTFDLADANDDEKISQEELVWMAKYTELVFEKFHMDDKDGNGFITTDEIPVWSIKDYDYNKDGQLSFIEYMMLDLTQSLTSDSLSSWNFEGALSASAIGLKETDI